MRCLCRNINGRLINSADHPAPVLITRQITLYYLHVPNKLRRAAQRGGQLLATLTSLHLPFNIRTMTHPLYYLTDSDPLRVYIPRVHSNAVVCARPYLAASIRNVEDGCEEFISKFVLNLPTKDSLTCLVIAIPQIRFETIAGKRLEASRTLYGRCGRHDLSCSNNVGLVT